MSAVQIAPKTVTVRSVVEELDREGTRILLPFLERTGQIAELLFAGKSVDPAYLQEGIRLWNDYLHEVRGPRLDAMVKGLEASAGPEIVVTGSRNLRHHLGRKHPEATVETDWERFEQVEEDLSRETSRARALRDRLSDYRNQQFQAAPQLASLLHADSFTDRAWIRYEHDTFAACLNRSFSSAAAAQVQATFQATESLRVELETAIGRYLQLAIPPRA